MSRELTGWTVQADGRHRCDRCGMLVVIEETDPLPIRHACRKGVATSGAETSPSAARRIMNFTVAAIGHLLHGAPTCSQEEIDTRLAICHDCTLFNGTTCNHRDCGCRANNRRRFLNKLAWADQACPLNKWDPIVRETTDMASPLPQKPR